MSADKLQLLWRQGEDYAKQRQWGAALKAYEGVLELDTGHVLALLRAARAATLVGRYRAAHDYSMRAHARHPSADEPVLQLARMLRGLNESSALLECVAHSRWQQCRSAEWLTEMAMLVSSVGDNALAMHLLDLAIVRDPNHPPARYFRGVVQMFFGNMDVAELELERCLAKSPTFTQAYWVLSRLRKQTGESNHVQRMRTQLPRIPPGGDSNVYLAFAMHNELHDLGRYDEAWAALQHGCQVKRRLTPHDRNDARTMYEGLQALCDAQFVQPVAPVAAPFVPIFIVGMHRSGSTLLEQLLGGHPLVTDGGETYAFTAQMRYAADYNNQSVLDSELVRRAVELDYPLIAERFFANMGWRAKGKPYLTEKLPSNFLNLGFIAKALPQARILHMVRDPLDTCFSNLRTMFSNANAFSYDQTELAEWYGQYHRLMARWHAVMPGRIMDVHYDALVEDPEMVMRQVLEFCGLPWDPAATSLDQREGTVATASSPQVRGGIIKGRGAAWVPYEAKLKPLIEGLAPFRS